MDPDKVFALWMGGVRLVAPGQEDSPYVKRARRDDTRTVIKRVEYTDNREANAMQLVRQQTSIPIPAVRTTCLVPSHSSSGFIVMDFIPGRPLDRCWDDLFIWTKVWVLWKIRSYIRQLRRVRYRQHEVPGPIGDGPLPCDSQLFGLYGAGPFATTGDMTAWFARKLRACQRVGRAPKDAPAFDTLGPLVMSHQDLCPRNLLLGDDGRLWVLDWENAGFYPRWFEYAVMRYYSQENPWLWRKALPLVAGFYERVTRWMRYISWAVNVAPFAGDS